jgi:tetratricopeptide (TPR) repeat protein
LGDIALKQQKPDEARALLKQALRLFADIRIAHYDLGVLAGEAQQYGEAAAEFKESIRLDPKEVDAHFRLAQVYRKQGKTNLAEAELKTVSEMQQRKQEHLYKELSGEAPAAVP